MEDNGKVVGCVDMIDRGEGAGLRSAKLAVEQGIEGPFHIACGQRLSVVEANTVVQVKDVGLRIGSFPAIRQPGLQLKVFVAANQRVEEHLIDALGLRVDANPWVEVGGAALDDHYQGVGIWLARAGGEERDGDC